MGTARTLHETSPLSLDQRLDIVALGGIERPVFSPDGTQVVVASALGGATNLWGLPVDGAPPVRHTSRLGHVGHLAWVMPRFSPDGRFLSWVAGDHGQMEVWLQPLDGAAAFQLTRIGASISAIEWAPDGQSVVVSANRHGAYDVFQVTVPDGRLRRLTDGDTYEVNPVLTPDGRRLLWVELDETWTRHVIHAADIDLATGQLGQRWVVATDEDFFDYHYGRSFGPPVVSPDGDTVLFRSYRSGWVNVWSVPTSGGTPTALAADAADQDMPAWSPDGSHVAFTSNTDANVSVVAVDVGTGQTRVVVDAVDEVCGAPAWSPDGATIACTIATPTCPADLHLVDVATGDRTRLTRSVAPAVEAHLARPERIEFERDGLVIPGLLYKPQDAGVAPNGAGIVLVHGGPTMQWFPAHDGYLQFLVGLGYAVLTPNIRGSSGYGRAFEEANDRDWLGGDLQDVIAARDCLRAAAGVGPVAVTGLSYGGIMAMGVVSFAPDEFDAAVSLSGYGDFLDMMDEQEFRHQQLLRKELGDPVADEDVYRRASPLYAVHNATTPAFIAHGVGRYPHSDAGRQYAEALQREYKTVTHRTYPDEHYYVTGRDNLARLWRDVEEFLAVYLDLEPAAAAAAGPPTVDTAGLPDADAADEEQR